MQRVIFAERASSSRTCCGLFSTGMGGGDSEQAEVRSLIRRNGSPPLVEFDGSTDSSFAGYKMKGKVERERRYKKWIKPVRED